jgi:hypothetical protein
MHASVGRVLLAKLFPSLFVTGLVMSLATVPAQAAPAVVLDATCVGTSTVNYQPGLTYTPQSVTVQGTINLNCVSSNLSTPLLLEGTISGGGTGTLNCALLNPSSSGTSSIAWKTINGAPYATSTYTYTTSIGPGAAGTTVHTNTGNITSGLFAGDGILLVTVYANLDLDACGTPEGLTSRSGPSTAEITSLL